MHISCGRLKAGAGKETGDLKPTATSTEDYWTCSPLRSKAGAAGWEKGLMVACASPIKPWQPVLQKGYRGQGLGSASALSSHSQGWEKHRDRRVGNRTI